MPITDLTGYTWVGNSTVLWEGPVSYNVNFIIKDMDNEEYNFVTFDFIGSSKFYAIQGNNSYDIAPMDITTTLTFNSYISSITFAGGTDATNSTLIAWLEANGTLTAPSPQVQAISSFNTISLTDNTDYITLTINGESFDLETINQPSGYTVGVEVDSIVGLGGMVKIYDGQNNSGTLLGMLETGNSSIFTITSGYIYTENANGFTPEGTYYFSKNFVNIGNPATINEDCFLIIQSTGPEEPGLIL